MYLPFDTDTEPPKFKECARHPKVEEEGFVLYYTDQCPFTCYWVPRVAEVAKEHNISFRVIHVTSREAAQNVPAPVTTYALFRDGRFLTQGIQSDKKFLALVGRESDRNSFFRPSEDRIQIPFFPCSFASRMHSFSKSLE